MQTYEPAHETARHNHLLFERVENTDGSAAAFAKFPAIEGARNYVVAYSAFNSSATAGYLDIRDGVSGDILWTIPLPAGGGANLSGEAPLFYTSRNTALAYDVSAALTTVYLSISGYQA